MSFWKLYKIPLALTLISLLLYWFFAYQLIRTDYTKLILWYSLLWLVFVVMLKYTNDNIRFLTIIALLSRVVFIFAIPNLSQDFYRFIWDGRMLLEGFNPYLYTPESLIHSENIPIKQAHELYAGMGTLNGSHFTNYPPINQLCFAIAGLFSNQSILGSVITLRLLISAADIGIFYFGKRLLEQLQIPVKHLFWYLLNPFVIIELNGNLHFEGVMIFFLVWSLYLLHKGHWKWAALVFALSISVKLIPLLFLPLLFPYFKKPTVNSNKINSSKKPLNGTLQLLGFYGIVGITTVLLFIPFFSTEFLINYTQTVSLWFQNFEFNASIYYLARQFGYALSGYNQIAILGKILPILVILFVTVLTFYKKSLSTKTLITYMLFAFTVYLFLSTTVHPWYIATLLFLSVFTHYKFPLVWSFVIILSYLAYTTINIADKSENLWIIGLEYSIVYTVLIWEIFIKKANSKELAKS